MDYGNNKITACTKSVRSLQNVEVGHYTEEDGEEEQTRKLISARKTSLAVITHMVSYSLIFIRTLKSQLATVVYATQSCSSY